MQELRIFSKGALLARMRLLVLRAVVFVVVLGLVLAVLAHATRDGHHLRLVPATIWRDTSIAALVFVGLLEIYRGRRRDRTSLVLTIFFVLVAIAALRGVLFA